MFRLIVGSGSRGKNQPEVLGHSSRQGLEPENALNLNGLLCAIWCYPANTLVLGVSGGLTLPADSLFVVPDSSGKLKP